MASISESVASSSVLRAQQKSSEGGVGVTRAEAVQTIRDCQELGVDKTDVDAALARAGVSDSDRAASFKVSAEVKQASVTAQIQKPVIGSATFKALKPEQQRTLLNYIAQGDPKASATRASHVADLVKSDMMKDPTVRDACLKYCASAPDTVMRMSALADSESFKTPDVSQMKNKDVNHARLLSVRLIGSISTSEAKARSPEKKQILANTLDGLTGANGKAKIRFTELDDANIGAFHKEGTITFNTKAFDLESDTPKSGELAANGAHEYGHAVRSQYFAQHPSPQGSAEHFMDEVHSYYTEFTVRYDSPPPVWAMEKATSALLKEPYEYAGEVSKKTEQGKQILSIKNAVTRGGEQEPAPTFLPSPEGAKWNKLND